MPKPKTPTQAIKSAQTKAAREARKKRDRETLEKMKERDTDAHGNNAG